MLAVEHSYLREFRKPIGTVSIQELSGGAIVINSEGTSSATNGSTTASTTEVKEEKEEEAPKVTDVDAARQRFLARKMAKQGGKK